ncbi:MAG: putative quinol monooxygenase [Polaromonas sp.]
MTQQATVPGCTIIGMVYGKPEKRDELIALLASFVAPTRAEAGCIEYQFHVSQEDPNAFMFYENWASREALAEHLDTPHIAPILARKAELLSREIEIRYYDMLAPFQAKRSYAAST